MLLKLYKLEDFQVAYEGGKIQFEQDNMVEITLYFTFPWEWKSWKFLCIEAIFVEHLSCTTEGMGWRYDQIHDGILPKKFPKITSRLKDLV